MNTFSLLFRILWAAELIACICAFATWKKWKATPWRWFGFYLLFIVLAESYGVYKWEWHHYLPRKILYQFVVIPLEFLVVYLMFHATSGSGKRSRFPILCCIIYLISWIANTAFSGNLETMWLSFSYMVGALLILTLVLRFFLGFVMSDSILSFSTNMMFWVCAGWMVFYLGSFPFYGLNKAMGHNHPQLFNRLGYLAYTLNIIMYSLFAIGYIWSKPSSRYS